MGGLLVALVSRFGHSMLGLGIFVLLTMSVKMWFTLLGQKAKVSSSPASRTVTD